jgi:hypothetical protein
MSARILQRLVTSLAALLLMSGLALAQSKVVISVGGAGCLCYLPTMLANTKRPASRSNSSISRAARNRSPP